MEPFKIEPSDPFKPPELTCGCEVQPIQGYYYDPTWKHIKRSERPRLIIDKHVKNELVVLGRLLNLSAHVILIVLDTEVHTEMPVGAYLPLYGHPRDMPTNGKIISMKVYKTPMQIVQHYQCPVQFKPQQYANVVDVASLQEFQLEHLTEEMYETIRKAAEDPETADKLMSFEHCNHKKNLIEFVRKFMREHEESRNQIPENGRQLEKSGNPANVSDRSNKNGLANDAAQNTSLVTEAPEEKGNELLVDSTKGQPSTNVSNKSDELVDTNDCDKTIPFANLEITECSASVSVTDITPVKNGEASNQMEKKCDESSKKITDKKALPKAKRKTAEQNHAEREAMKAQSEKARKEQEKRDKKTKKEKQRKGKRQKEEQAREQEKRDEVALEEGMKQTTREIYEMSFQNYITLHSTLRKHTFSENAMETIKPETAAEGFECGCEVHMIVGHYYDPVWRHKKACERPRLILDAHMNDELFVLGKKENVNARVILFTTAPTVLDKMPVGAYLPMSLNPRDYMVQNMKATMKVFKTPMKVHKHNCIVRISVKDFNRSEFERKCEYMREHLSEEVIDSVEKMQKNPACSNMTMVYKNQCDHEIRLNRLVQFLMNQQENGVVQSSCRTDNKAPDSKSKEAEGCSSDSVTAKAVDDSSYLEKIVTSESEAPATAQVKESASGEAGSHPTLEEIVLTMLRNEMQEEEREKLEMEKKKKKKKNHAGPARAQQKGRKKNGSGKGKSKNKQMEMTEEEKEREEELLLEEARIEAFTVDVDQKLINYVGFQHFLRRHTFSEKFWGNQSLMDRELYSHHMSLNQDGQMAARRIFTVFVDFLKTHNSVDARIFGEALEKHGHVVVQFDLLYVYKTCIERITNNNCLLRFLKNLILSDRVK
ncbi:unnamed protein product [Caenorhabditis sp. 36 PRJEB53466]|nr:unnamed protein product [Caenorhabditis sp. 36 PRJEB53466]